MAIKRGEIYLVDLTDALGSEQKGVRPAVIVQNDIGNTHSPSVLLSRGFTLKDVQEWLGHADIKMTANVYGHLDMQRKNNIAEGMLHAIC